MSEEITVTCLVSRHTLKDQPQPWSSLWSLCILISDWNTGRAFRLWACCTVASGDFTGSCGFACLLPGALPRPCLGAACRRERGLWAACTGHAATARCELAPSGSATTSLFLCVFLGQRWVEKIKLLGLLSSQKRIRCSMVLVCRFCFFLWLFLKKPRKILL